MHPHFCLERGLTVHDNKREIGRSECKYVHEKSV